MLRHLAPKAVAAWLGRAALLISLGVGLLPAAGMLLIPLKTSVSSSEARPTNQVFVSKSSEAARRGYALPGEGRAAFDVLGQSSRSTRILLGCGALIALGTLVLAVALAIGRRVEPSRAGRRPLAAEFFSRLTGGLVFGVGFAFTCAIVSFFLIGPMKLAPESIFNVGLVGVLVAALAAAYKFGPGFSR